MLPAQPPNEDRAKAYIEHCVIVVIPIDRARLSGWTTLAGRELESFLCRTICAFCLKSQGRSGSFAPQNAPRNGKLKQGVSGQQNG